MYILYPRHAHQVTSRQAVEQKMNDLHHQCHFCICRYIRGIAGSRRVFHRVCQTVYTTYHHTSIHAVRGDPIKCFEDSTAGMTENRVQTHRYTWRVQDKGYRNPLTYRTSYWITIHLTSRGGGLFGSAVRVTSLRSSYTAMCTQTSN